jgi:HAMP domain-containing protein
MDAGVMDLVDEIEALKAEIRRIRAAAGHVIDKSCFSNAEELESLGKAIRKLEIELERFAPSMALNPQTKVKGKRPNPAWSRR